MLDTSALAIRLSGELPCNLNMLLLFCYFRAYLGGCSSKNNNNQDAAPVAITVPNAFCNILASPLECAAKPLLSEDRIVVQVQKIADAVQHDCLRNGCCRAVPRREVYG